MIDLRLAKLGESRSNLDADHNLRFNALSLLKTFTIKWYGQLTLHLNIPYRDRVLIAPVATRIDDHNLSPRCPLSTRLLPEHFPCSWHQHSSHTGWHNPQASGVKPSPECLSTYQRLKVKDSSGVKLEYIIYKIQFYPGENKKPDIVVEKESTVADYEKFVEDLPENECRWGVFDFEYESGEGKRKKIVFVMWYVPTRLQEGNRRAYGVISGLLTLPLSKTRWCTHPPNQVSAIPLQVPLWKSRGLTTLKSLWKLVCYPYFTPLLT